MNQVLLTGRITNDVELKNTSTPLVNLTVAVEREYKDDKGERITDFIDVTVWRKSAEFIVKYGSKGDVVGIVGQLQKRSYERDGKNIWVTDVVAEKVSIISKYQKQEVKQEVKQVKTPTKPLATDEELPF